MADSPPTLNPSKRASEGVLKPKKLVRSASEKAPRRNDSDSDIVAAKSSLKVPEASASGNAKPEKSSGFSLKRFSRSLRIGKGKNKDEPAEPVATSSSVPSPSVPLERKKSGFKKFLNSLKGKRSTEVMAGGSSASSTTSPTQPVKKSDFFKSKKGKHLWVSRYGQDEITLLTIPIRDLIELEEQAIKKYAINTLSEMLLRPVMYDPFSTRSLNRDLMHRRSTFGERFRNAFKKQSSHLGFHSPLKPATSNSSLGGLFGRSLDDVLLDDRIRTGNARLKVPLVISQTVEYLKKHVKSSGIFRVPGNAKRIRQLNEMFECGNTIDISFAQPSDVASVLKYFLRELPEPLLTFELYQNFIDVPDLKSVEDQLLALRLLCCLLPAINREVLSELLELLALVASVADQPDGSRMNSHNLALIFSPNLLKDKPVVKKGETASLLSGTDDGNDASLVLAEGEASEVLELMIDYNEHLFVLPPELRDLVMVYHHNMDSDYVASIIRALIKREQSPNGEEVEIELTGYRNITPTSGSQPQLDASSDDSGADAAVAISSSTYEVAIPSPTTPSSAPKFLRPPSNQSLSVQPITSSPLRTVFDASSIPWKSESTSALQPEHPIVAKSPSQPVISSAPPAAVSARSPSHAMLSPPSSQGLKRVLSNRRRPPAIAGREKGPDDGTLV